MKALCASKMAPCHTKAVFRQAASELHGKCKLEDDVIKELHSQTKNWLASDPADTSGVDGYIQAIDETPFYATFYLHEQVEIYVQTCKRQDRCVVHFGATGTVVKIIIYQKVVLYGCLITAADGV